MSGLRMRRKSEPTNIKVTVLSYDSRDSPMYHRSSPPSSIYRSTGISSTPVRQERKKCLEVKVRYFTLNQPREICEDYGAGDTFCEPSFATTSRRASSSSNLKPQGRNREEKALSSDTIVDDRPERRRTLNSDRDNAAEARRMTEETVKLLTTKTKTDSKKHKKSSSRRSRKSSTSSDVVTDKLGSSVRTSVMPEAISPCNVARHQRKPVSTFSLVLLPFKIPLNPRTSVASGRGRNTEPNTPEAKVVSSSGVSQVNRTSKQSSPEVLHRAPWVAWGRWYEAVEDERRSEVLSSLMYRHKKTIPFPLLPLTRPLVKGSSLNRNLVPRV
uniref:Uncharacterized protein n=1 Tax=Branchiostoma floridae TaxID=7739 RepID=C3ZLE9_BRAFL|eukprot:XP_002590575.1 hypothetical protein BRAFLDRAFT_83788 [Branchiostoma floridae]